MLISYPFLPARGADTTDDAYEKIILDMEMLNAGVYPSSREREWHGGIHLQAPNMIEPVRAIADGTIVAYRLNSELTKEREDDAEGRIDNSFVLIKHETESDSLQDASGTEQPVKIVFYSLYMHLMNTGEMKKRGIDGKAIHAAISESGNGVKLCNGAKVYRKDIIGYPGESYSTAGMIHFEIFTTDEALSAFFVDSKNADEIGTKGTWGDSYFVVKAGSPARADHPGVDKGKIGGRKFPVGTAGTVDSAKNLFLRIAYRNGTKYTTTWLDEGRDTAPTLLTSEEGVADEGYEYAMYGIATALYKSCPSAGMELLRMGKMIGPDRDKLSAEDGHNWQLVTYADGRQGYVDLADAAVVEHVLSDADFPYWLGWQKKDGGLFGSNGQCDMRDLLDVLKVAHDDETGDTARQQLRDYFNDAEHRHVRDWAQRMVCRYPSEWDKRNNARCGKLKEKDGLGPGKDGPYVGNDDEFEKHMQFVESLQWWEDVGLGDSNVWHFHPLGFISHMRRCGWLDTGDMAQCFPRSLLYLKGTEFAEESTPWRIASATADRWHVPFNRAARRYGISRSKQRLLHLFAHVIPETGNMRLVREINGEHKKYSPYYGRGLIQLTHLETYQRYGRFRTLSDATCPQMYRELGWDPDARIARDNAGHFDALNCADSACFYVFWRANMLKHLDHGVSQDDATIASKDVNGYVAIQNLNGLDRRLQAVLYLKTVLLDELRAGDSDRLTFHWRRSSELEVFLDANGNPIMDPHTHQVKKGYIAGIHTIDAPLTPQRP
jgi:hypothetical protein